MKVAFPLFLPRNKWSRRFREELVRKWWEEWLKVAFPLFLPRNKWSRRFRDLKEGDIVLLRYDQKFGEDKFRLGRVLAVHPDPHGVVRTVTVGVRDRRGKKTEQWNRCKSKLAELVVGIQRLVVILPVEEQTVQPTSPLPVEEEQSPLA